MTFVDWSIVDFYDNHPAIGGIARLAIIVFSIYLAFKVNENAESPSKD